MMTFKRFADAIGWYQLHEITLLGVKSGVNFSLFVFKQVFFRFRTMKFLSCFGIFKIGM